MAGQNPLVNHCYTLYKSQDKVANWASTIGDYAMNYFHGEMSGSHQQEEMYEWKDTVAPMLYMLITISMYWTINKVGKKYNNISEMVDGIYKDSTNKEDFVNNTYTLQLTSNNSRSIDKIKGILGSLYDKRKELEDQIVPTWGAKIGKKSWDIGRNQVVAKRCRGFRADQDFRQNIESIKNDFLRNSIVEITKKFEQATGLKELPALASSHYR